MELTSAVALARAADDYLYRLYKAGLCSLKAVLSFQKYYSDSQILQKDLGDEEYFCTVLMFVVNYVQRFDADVDDREH